MIKEAFNESFSYKLLRPFIEAYGKSEIKRVMDALSRWYNASAIGRVFTKFTYKQPRYQYSIYQKTLDKISAWISVLAAKLNAFFTRLLDGSKAAGAFLGFVNNGAESKFRAVGFFGFWFFWAATVLGIFGIIGRGRAAASFVLALVFLVASVLAGKLDKAIKDSFFVKLLTGLFASHED